MRLIFTFCFCCLLIGCAQYQTVAPVRDADLRQVGANKVYRVRYGETLYFIAWRYDQDYQKLIRLNHLKAPYRIYPGQRLIIFGKEKPVLKKAHFKKTIKRTIKPKQKIKTKAKVKVAPSFKMNKRWLWPVRGKIATHFSLREKGINIAARYRQKIVAANNGQVVYAGNGIPTYGYLVIIKHNRAYLTAYGYCSKLLVRENQKVKAGQPIALVGENTQGRSILHFEVRYYGKPKNPLRYL